MTNMKHFKNETWVPSMINDRLKTTSASLLRLTLSLVLLFHSISMSTSTMAAFETMHFVSQRMMLHHPFLCKRRRQIKSYLHISHNNDAEYDIDPGDALFLERYRRRRDTLLHRRQNQNYPADDPIRTAVMFILDSLSRPHIPAPYFGYKVLYEGSTPHWKEVLRKSVGASRDTEDAFIFSALGSSMERCNNQFGILVGVDEENDNSLQYNDDEIPQYKLEFPRDTLDYFDGTAWVECRLRDVHSDALLVVLGWSMKQMMNEQNSNNSDLSSVWLVDGIDWQDFREKYRPGIGREEWERICG